ncbi:Unannotated [Lentimonas sp. CC19]|nr:Unannotated [Lentimonas sp. CC19]
MGSAFFRGRGRGLWFGTDRNVCVTVWFGAGRSACITLQWEFRGVLGCVFQDHGFRLSCVS